MDFIDPRIQQHPGAYKAVTALRYGVRGLLFLLLPLLYFSLGLGNVGGTMLISWASLLVFCSIARVILNLLYFVRFSLWTMYLVVLTLGGFIAVGVGFPGWGPILALQGGGLVIVLTMLCVSLYEPADGKIFDPEFKYVPRTKEERNPPKWHPPEP